MARAYIVEGTTGEYSDQQASPPEPGAAAMSPVTLPDVSRTTDRDVIRKRLVAYEDMLLVEQERRRGLTPAQQLAERLNEMFSREPGEAWYCEGENWGASEHKRWLDKANALMEDFPDEYVREDVIKHARGLR